MSRIAFVIAITAICGCTSGFRDTRTTASIDDGLTSNGFTIAAVDGMPPTRSHHPIHTMVPLVLVKAGRHTFTMEGGEQSFEAEVQAGKRYRTELRDGVPVLAEEPSEAEEREFSE